MLSRLETKLHPPRVADDFVLRPRLFDKLNGGLSRKLTLVSAPAGFGKTSLIAWWITSTSHPTAWLSLDEGDNDAAVFFDYLVGAIQKVVPDACPQTQAILQGPQDLSGDVLARSLINDIAQIQQQFILVLDDYHCILDSVIHEIVARLIRYQPQQLHLVIVSRADPPLPLNSLRAAHMTEVRADDLRFSREETRLFLTSAARTPLNDPTLSWLEERMEGWAAGLRLAAMSVQDHQKPAAFAAMIEGASQHIMAYLLDEVQRPVTLTVLTGKMTD